LLKPPTNKAGKSTLSVALKRGSCVAVQLGTNTGPVLNDERLDTVQLISLDSALNGWQEVKLKYRSPVIVPEGFGYLFSLHTSLKNGSANADAITGVFAWREK